MVTYVWGVHTRTNTYTQIIAIMMQVESQRLELLSHPIVTKLLDHKWKSFGLPFYLVNMGTYLIFLACLTAFALVSPTPNSDDCKLKFKCNIHARLGEIISS